MGLDMYAYLVKQEIVGDLVVDITEDLIADKCSLLPEFAGVAVGDTDWKKRDSVLQKAKALGIVDTEFAYWRKFNNLHGWMEKLYRENLGTRESFNCVGVRLLPSDLCKLETAALAKSLEPTPGFFFGSQEPMSDDDKENVLEFVKRAGAAIEEGYAVIYTSWW